MQQQSGHQSLLGEVALGDRRAFKLLYEATAPRVYAVVLRMLRDPAAAQDVLQDTYLKVWSRASEYHSERGEVLAWITGIARYRALDLLRAEKRRNTALGDIELLLDPPAAGDERNDLLAKCLERLAEIQRSSILAAFINGFTHEELALHQHTPVGTVKSRIRRGLQSLRECLEQ